MTFSVLGEVAALVVYVLGTVGLPGLFALMVVESFGVPPLPSEVILPFAGYLVAEGAFSYTSALLVAVLGGVLGAFAAYAVGRWWRHRLERIGIGALRLHPRHLAMMDRFFARRGELTVGVARLIPVVRSYISYPAGTAQMSPFRFGLYTAVGLVPFAAGFLYAGVVLRSHWSVVETVFVGFNYVLLAAVVVGGVYLYLLLTDRVTPGWPPRRTPRAPSS
jgi:membrane protein DedA with SNARE-associated domain